ncbi:MAG: RagB/SusD family nutrient uptake outer membrane protein, partial [Bacteroidales bacterium]
PLLSSIDLPSLLTERAIELYTECHRRQDMIRFGTFLDPKADKPYVSDESRLLMPIPQDAIDAIADENILSQNPGY